MADVIKKSTNKFTKGLVMDFSPENTRNEVLTHALNATLLTFNGNELSLQNDMGNARVETAYLPEGYIPVGTCEYGGIIYIVSYNPLEDKSQIGCFPSPERNVSNEELGTSDAKIQADYFQETVEGILTGVINNNAQYVLLKEDHLNPGDKFLTYADSTIYNEKLADLQKTENGQTSFIENPVLALNIVSIEDSGKIIYLNSDLRQYSKTIGSDDSAVEYNYHILGEDIQGDGGFEHKAIDIDSYRNVVSSGYNVFRSKTSGRLALLAELIMIDSYSVTHSIRPTKDINGDVVAGSFDVLLHTEVSPNLTSENFATAPKLSYYHLKESQGYISHTSLNASSGVVNTPLFDDGKLNDQFLNIPLTNIYTPSVDINLKGFVSDTGKFRFPFSNTYHGKMLDYTDESMSDLSEVYTLVTAGNYHRLDKDQVLDSLNYFKSQDISFYVYNPDQGEWHKVDPQKDVLIDERDYFTKTEIDHFDDVQRNTQYRNEVLWEQKYNPLVANNLIVGDDTIQKYQKVESYKYVEIALADIQDGMTIVKRDPKKPDTYIIVSNPQEDAGVTYFERMSMVVYNPVDQNTALQLEKEYQILYYYPNEPEYVVVSEKVKEEYWAMGSNDRYPYEEGAPWGYTKVLYRKWIEPQYNPATEEELRDYYKPNATPLYYKTNYVKVSDLNSVSVDLQLFMVPYRDTYLLPNHFTPDSLKNYILGKPKPSKANEHNYSKDGLQYDVPISLHTLASFIPQKQEVDNEIKITQYEDLKLGTLKLPQVVADNELDLPFKYNYTVVPCMNYGRLDHLAVSNTVDFSQLHAFNHSNFNTWKYHIDESQLRLTFGAEIFDTFEDNKVDGLILEFYDLWGFAGSLEINDKKSYSGVFTKILTLGSPNVLSRKLIVGNQYKDGYKHHISIAPKDGGYYLNDKSLTWSSSQGWNIDEEYNDCGTLYPNVIYGVKTYLRQTSSDGTYKFTRKKDFFLYTLPIFNDYYYTVNDFSAIENPTLDLMLTYKLTDSSQRLVYTSDTVKNGYDLSEDYDPVSEYLKGQYKESVLTGTRYYQYIGTSNLCLEIGLKQEYQQFGLSYDPALNDLFSCTLQLVGDDSPDKTFTINAGTSDQQGALNYKSNTGLDENSNTITFGELETPPVNKLVISKGEFSKYNFITANNYNTIPIKYKFVIGYPFSINDIRNTEITTTTVCALLHKNTQGRYNLEDFGLHDISTDASTPIYLSNRMFMNSGTYDYSSFGIYSHNSVTGNAAEQYTKIDVWKGDYYDISKADTRKLNTGSPLKQAASYIGKLTFMQPHAHNELNTDRGVNIYLGATDKDGNAVYRLAPNQGGFWVGSKDNYDDTYGCRPIEDIYNNPCYNMSINTKASINTFDEFISTMDYQITSGTIYGYDRNDDGRKGDTVHGWGGPYNMRRFVGFTGPQLEKFYSKFTTTMKNVYAYNMDYGQIPIQVGEVQLSDNPVSFTSHLISIASSLDFDLNKVFNDYLYLGTVSFTTYFQQMQLFSKKQDDEGIETFIENGNTPKSHLNFQPGYTYLGKSDGAYLLTSLTYNTSVPSELQSQLEIKTSNMTCVKKSDGSYTFIEGEPNRNLLYGFDEDKQKLVQLDVSNYTIDEHGLLHLRPLLPAGSGSFDESLTPTILQNLCGDGHTFKHEIVSSSGEDSVIPVKVALRINSDFYLTIDYTRQIVYFISSPQVTFSPFELSKAILPTSDGYEYNVAIAAPMFAHKCGCKSIALKLDISEAGIKALPADILYSLVNDADLNDISFTYINSDGVSTLFQGKLNAARVDVMSTFLGPDNLQVASSNQSIVITAVKLGDIPFTFTRSFNYQASNDSIIYVTPTKDYSKIENHRYVLINDDYNEARLRGTSIVVNDLYFDALSEGHRLYMQSSAYTYDNEPRARIYYRAFSQKASWSSHRRIDDVAGPGDVINSSYDYSNCNNLCLHTGPCFTLDNL